MPDSASQNQRSGAASRGSGEPSMTICMMMRKTSASSRRVRLTTAEPILRPLMVNKVEPNAKKMDVPIAVK